MNLPPEVTMSEKPVIDQQGDGLIIYWQEGGESFFHYVWLRDCCYCELCGDSYSSNRFLHASDVAMDVSPKSLELKDSTTLNITWEQGDHKSSYDLCWLKQYDYSDGALRSRFHRPKPWDAGIIDSLPSVRYKQVVESDEERLTLFRKLLDYGFVVVRGGPVSEQGAQNVAELIGEVAESAYGQFFDLSPKGKHKTAGNTMFPIPPHTDEAFRYSPPGVNILHCIQPAKSGGESILVDGFMLGEVLRDTEPEKFEVLVKQPQPFHRVARSSHIDQRTRGPVFTTDENGTIVGFRFHPRSAAPLDVPRDLFLAVYGANKRLCELMFDEAYQAKFKLNAGDAVLFDNHRVMHSRKGFQDENRRLRICNVSREQFHEQFRLTAFRLGYIEESQLVLGAGVCG